MSTPLDDYDTILDEFDWEAEAEPQFDYLLGKRMSKREFYAAERQRKRHTGRKRRRSQQEY